MVFIIFKCKTIKDIVEMHNIDSHIKTRKTMTNDFVCNNYVADDQYRT